jgi:hypothetical protein
VIRWGPRCDAISPGTAKSYIAFLGFFFFFSLIVIWVIKNIEPSLYLDEGLPMVISAKLLENKI